MPRLCLSRREGQRVRIGADVWVEVVSVQMGGKRRQARLVITAPAEVPIWREELLAHVEREGANGTPAGKK